MKRTSVRVCMVVVFCLMFSSVRTSQMMAASAANTHRGEPNLLYEDGPDIIHQGNCQVSWPSFKLTGNCAGPFIRACWVRYAPSQCPPGAKMLGEKFVCSPVQIVDAGRPCFVRF